jgi:hypothetical protein
MGCKAWWQLLWEQALAPIVEAGNVPVHPVSTAADNVAGDAARAAHLDANPTQGWVPGTDVVPTGNMRTMQGSAKITPTPDAAHPRSPQVPVYIKASYDRWVPLSPAPTPVEFYVIDRVQVPPHPVFTRTPSVVPTSSSPIYQ